VLLLGELERHILAERQVAASIAAAGGEVDLPSFAEARFEFDQALVAELEPESAKEKILRELGV
jgi:hypothetical protein